MSETNGKKLPTGWAMAKIEDLFWPLEDGRTLHQGWSPQCEKTPAPTDDDWGVLKTTAIQAGAFLPQYNKSLPKRLTPRQQTEVKSGDILITCAGPRVRCGVACLVRQTRPRLMMSGKMYRFRVSPDHFDARFLEAYLLTSRATAAVDKMKTGGSDSGLNLTHDRFRPLPVPVAPLKEQRRIMDAIDELFSDLDAGIATLERVQAKLKIYRASVLKAAVEGALTADWRAKHTVTESAEVLLTHILAERRRLWEKTQIQKFKDAGKDPTNNWKAKYQDPAAPNATKFPTLPEGWCWASVDHLLSAPIINGISVRGTDGPPGIPALRLNAMSESGFDYSIKRYLPLKPTDVDDLWITADDFFVSRGNGSKHLVGRGTFAQSPPERIIFPDTMMRLRFIKESIALKWISTIWSSGFVRNQIERIAKTTAGIYKISQPDLARITVPVPPMAEQEAIVEAVEDQLSVIDHLQADLETKLKSAQALRQSILHHAFTGQIVPQNPKDESAAELLKRIAVQRDEIIRQAKAAKQKKPKTKAPRKIATGKSATK